MCFTMLTVDRSLPEPEVNTIDFDANKKFSVVCVVVCVCKHDFEFVSFCVFWPIFTYFYVFLRIFTHFYAFLRIVAIRFFYQKNMNKSEPI